MRYNFVHINYKDYIFKNTFSLATLVATAMILASCGGSSDSSAQTCDSLIASKTTWVASNICSDGYSQEISATFNSDGTYTSYRDNSIGNGVWECSNNTLETVKQPPKSNLKRVSLGEYLTPIIPQKSYNSSNQTPIFRGFERVLNDRFMHFGRD